MFVDYWRRSNAGNVHSLRSGIRITSLRLVYGTDKAAVGHCFDQDRMLIGCPGTA